MKKKCLVLIVAILSLFINYAFGNDHMLPFEGGTTWTCTQGTFEDPDNYWDKNTQSVVSYQTNPTHNSEDYDGAFKYALDFGFPLRTPIVATRSGTITYTNVSNATTGWGTVIIINYDIDVAGPSNEFGRYAHLNEIVVEVGDYVRQGELIGYSGNTGYSEGPHLHYQFEDQSGQSQSVSFIDAEETDRIPKRFVPVYENPNGLRHYYTSMNTHNPFNNFRVGKFVDGWRIEPFDVSTSDYVFSRPFALTYRYYGGLNLLGHTADNVRQLSALEMPGYDSDKNIDLPWAQDITNISGGEAWLTLVINPFVENLRMGHLCQIIYGVVFPIHGRIRDYWRAYYSDYGYPACNEYYWPNIDGDRYVIQWFEKSPGNYEKISYDTADGSFNDPETASAVIGNHADQSVWDNLGCPNGDCGVGGGVDPIPSDNYTINRSTTCKDVQSSDPWNPINETTLFYKVDNYVWSWIELNDVNKSLQMNWKWYNSDNIFVSESGYTTNPPPDGCIWGWYRCPKSLSIAGINNYGQYHVDIYIDNQKVKTDYFTITIDLNPPTELRIIE